MIQPQTSKNHAFKFIFKKSFSLYPLDNLERKFKNEFIYFTLESIQSCSISMRVEFNRDNNILSTEKSKDADLEEGMESPLYFSIPPPMTKEVPPNDRVLKYVRHMPVWKKDAQVEWCKRKEKREIRKKMALRKKNIMMKESIKKNIFYLHRWEYITKVSKFVILNINGK